MNILKRWNTEKNGLSGGYFHNIHLQRAWDKYGADSFRFYILERCGEELLMQREQYWIARLNTFDDGYNQTIGGDGTIGIVFTDERRRKLSESHAGAKSVRAMAVYCFELDVTLWGAKEAARLYNEKYKVRANGVSNCCKGIASYSGKLEDGTRLHWCYADEKDSYTIPLVAREKPIYCFELDEVFPNNMSAVRDSRILQAKCGNITRCCNHDPHYSTCGKLSDGTRLTWRYATSEEIHSFRKQLSLSVSDGSRKALDFCFSERK